MWGSRGAERATRQVRRGGRHRDDDGGASRPRGRRGRRHDRQRHPVARRHRRGTGVPFAVTVVVMATAAGSTKLVNVAVTVTGSAAGSGSVKDTDERRRGERQHAVQELPGCRRTRSSRPWRAPWWRRGCTSPSRRKGTRVGAPRTGWDRSARKLPNRNCPNEREDQTRRGAVGPVVGHEGDRGGAGGRVGDVGHALAGSSRRGASVSRCPAGDRKPRSPR